MMGIIRICLVADQPAIRQGLTMRIVAEPGLEVIGVTACDEAVSNQVQILRPYIALVVIDMTGLQGILTASPSHHVLPQAAIVMLSMQDDVLTCEQAENAGEVAVLSKLMPTDAMLEAIRHVASSVN